MKLIKDILENLNTAIQKNKVLANFKPVLNAMDEFFFGTSRVTSLPYILDYIDIKRFMSFVVIALIPATLAAIYFWGLHVLAMIIVSYIFGGMVEVAFAIARRKEIHEGFLVTGLIFPLILPPATPLWVVAVGVVFGVLFGKEVFGGTGRNVFNPAIVGRVFLTIAFPKIMTLNWPLPSVGIGTDAITGATPLALFKSQGILSSYNNLLFGFCSGSAGETFRIGLIAGGIFLILTRIVDWRIPFACLMTIFGFPYLSNYVFHTTFAPGVFQLLSGGVLLGAFFMATDPVTAPFTKAGRWIGGVFLGIMTVLIRGLSGYVEGLVFSILLLNACTPLIDTLVLKVRYRKK